MNNCLFKSFNPFLLDIRSRLIHGKYVLSGFVTSNTNRTSVTFYFKFTLYWNILVAQIRESELLRQFFFFLEIPNWLMFTKCLDYWVSDTVDKIHKITELDLINCWHVSKFVKLCSKFHAIFFRNCAARF